MVWVVACGGDASVCGGGVVWVVVCGGDAGVCGGGVGVSGSYVCLGGGVVGMCVVVVLWCCVVCGGGVGVGGSYV